MKKEIPSFTESIPYLIEQTSRYIELHGKAFFAKIAGDIITSEEFRALDAIINNPDICQRDLAKLLLRDRVRTGRLLDSLENKNLITRFGDLKNKRLVKKMKLTQQGENLFNELIQKFKPHVEILRKNFTDKQVEELKTLLNSLKSALAEIVEIPA